MTEKALQLKLVKWLKKKNIYHIKIISASTAGQPDYLCCIRGKFVAIECKSSDGVQSDLQKYREKEIKNQGGEYVLLTPNNWDFVNDILKCKL